MNRPQLVICPDAETLSWEAAGWFVRLAAEAVAGRGRFSVALSGGSTPRGLYALLAGEPYRSQVPWSQVHVFWGDERHVPPDHPDSNYRLARQTLLDRVPIPPGNVHRIPAERPDPQAAAAEYERTLRTFFGPGWPRFDLILLGLGADGHTASLFPGTAVLHETERLVAAPYVDGLSAHRLTLTPPVLNHAANVLFLVAGEGKAATLHAVLEGPYRPERFPSQLVRPAEGRLVWIVDRAAAGLLRP